MKTHSSEAPTINNAVRMLGRAINASLESNKHLTIFLFRLLLAVVIYKVVETLFPGEGLFIAGGGFLLNCAWDARRVDREAKQAARTS